MAELEKNLAAGLEAVRFVKSKMKYGAKNKVKDLIRTFGGSASCVEDLRAGEDKYIESFQSSMKQLKINQFGANERLIEYRAGSAAKRGCGNCAEQAAVAFIYLRDRNNYPLDYMVKPDQFLNFGGHAFVVIGRLEASDVTNPATWGEDAVVVDPHGSETAYPANQIDQYMPRVKFESHFRIKSKTDSAIRVQF